MQCAEQSRPQDEIRNINIADRSQAGPEMYAGSTDLTGFQEYFSTPFLVENTGEHCGSIKLDDDGQEEKQILPAILVNPHTNSHHYC